MGPRIAYYLSNKDYHGDKSHYSSTQLKDAAKDIEIFHNNYILGLKKPMSGTALDIGTYFHTAILEPHKLDEDCAVWKGFRRGPEWTKFAEENKHKAIITSGSELDKAMNCVKGVQNSPVALKIIKAGYPEVSAFMTIHIYKGKIYYFPDVVDVGFNAKVLTINGWVPAYLNPKVPTFKMGLKVRADSIDLDGLTVLDLKSASGDVKNKFIIRGKISDLDYDLSAALYLDVFSAATGDNFQDFIWTFSSKDTAICQNYRATRRNIMVGRAKWAKAVLEIAKYTKKEWKFVDDMAELEPNEFEMVWTTDASIFPEHDNDEEDLSIELSEKRFPIPPETVEEEEEFPLPTNTGVTTPIIDYEDGL